MNDKLYIIRYGEIALKGLNRHVYVNKLEDNIKRALHSFDGICIEKESGRIYVHCQAKDETEVVDVLKKIYGVVSFSPASTAELSLEAIGKVAVEQVSSVVNEHGSITFKVETRRANKKFDIKSPQLSSDIGSIILSEVANVSVNVRKPDYTCYIEVRDQAYIYTKVIKGQGGMPYGSAGKGLLLLSGGIDSPVAGYMMGKRGLELEAVHFHSYPYTSERAQQKVESLARKLTNYTGSINLHSVNLLEIQQAIVEHCPSREVTILSRRAMMKIATAIAKERGLKALVTGESLGQVASQTLEGINVTTDATLLPVFRPLIAMDKLDIVKISETIDTYETSILPFEDCCTVFLPKRVVTRPEVAKIRDSEALIPMDELVAKAVKERRVDCITNDEDLAL